MARGSPKIGPRRKGSHKGGKKGVEKSPKKTPNKSPKKTKKVRSPRRRNKFGLNTKRNKSKATGGSPKTTKKPHRFRSGTRALMEIRKAQRDTGLMTRSVLSYRHPPGADKSTPISAFGAGDCPATGIQVWLQVSIKSAAGTTRSDRSILGRDLRGCQHGGHSRKARDHCAQRHTARTKDPRRAPVKTICSHGT